MSFGYGGLGGTSPVPEVLVTLCFVGGVLYLLYKMFFGGYGN